MIHRTGEPGRPTKLAVMADAGEVMPELLFPEQHENLERVRAHQSRIAIPQGLLPYRPEQLPINSINQKREFRVAPRLYRPFFLRPLAHDQMSD